MWNLLSAAGVGLVVFALVTVLLGWVPALFPAVFFAVLSLFFLGRRTSRRVTGELERLTPLLQARKIDEAQALLRGVKERHGRWQLLLGAQIDAQLGMLEYLQLHWDEALPLLEKGRWRNGPALACIGAIHWRKGEKKAAYDALKRAQAAAPKDAMVAVVRAMLLLRDDRRDDALRALAEATTTLPDHKLLRELNTRVANKQKIDPKMFGDGWYQYFPEDLAKQMVTRGRRTPVPGAPAVAQSPRFGARHAPRR